MMNFRSVAALVILSLLSAIATARPSLIVTTDIGGGDPDDIQSMVRLLHYSNEFDIKAIIASSHLVSVGTSENTVRELITAYGDVRANLARHANGYPTTSSLLSALAAGQAYAGKSLPVFDSIGAGLDTPGSWKIINVVDQSADTINIAIWGGSADLAQALWRVRAGRSAAQVNAFLAKIKVHAIAHQDSTGPWIVSNFPSLFYILDYRTDASINAPFRGMYIGGDQSTTSSNWLHTNVVQNHGNLGSYYPSSGLYTAPNPYGAMKEGDTPSFFYFLENGLQDHNKPGFGGWGGRFTDAPNNLWTSDSVDSFAGSDGTPRTTVYRFRPAFNNEFAARADWAANGNYGTANHNPIAVLNGSAGRGIVYRTVKAGTRLALSAAGSSDPDGNNLKYRWWQYREAGTYNGAVTIVNGGAQTAELVTPNVSSNSTLHIILEVTDNGSPALTAYRRMVITVQPADDGSGTTAVSSGESTTGTAGSAAVSNLAWQSKTTGPNTKDEAIITAVARDNGDGRIAVTATVNLSGGAGDDDYMVNPWVKVGGNKRILYNGTVGGLGAAQKVPFTAVVYFSKPAGGIEWSLGYDNYYDASWAAQTGNGPESSASSSVELESTAPTPAPVGDTNTSTASTTVLSPVGLAWDSRATGPNSKDEAIIKLDAKDNGDGRIAVTALVTLDGGAGDNDYMVNPWVKIGSTKSLIYSGRIGGIGATQKVPYTKVLYFSKPSANVSWSVGYENYYDASWAGQTGKGQEYSNSGVLAVSSSSTTGTASTANTGGSTVTSDSGTTGSGSASGLSAGSIAWDSRTTAPNSKDEALITVDAKDNGDGRILITARVNLDGGVTDDDYIVNPWVQVGSNKLIIYSGSIGGKGASQKVPYSRQLYLPKPASNQQWWVGYDKYYDASWPAQTGVGAESSYKSTLVVAASSPDSGSTSTSTASTASTITAPVTSSQAVVLSWDSRSGGPNTKDEALISIKASETSDGRVMVTSTINLDGGVGDDDYVVNPWVQLGSQRQLLYQGSVGGRGASQKIPYTKVIYFNKPAAGATWRIGYDNYFDTSWPGQTGKGGESSG